MPEYKDKNIVVLLPDTENDIYPPFFMPLIISALKQELQ